MGFLELFGIRKKIDKDEFIILKKLFDGDEDEGATFYPIDILIDNNLNIRTVSVITDRLHAKGLIKKILIRNIQAVTINEKKINRIKKILGVK
jgi:hypothetical protein